VVRHILFDLDNTLSPPGAGLMAELDRRIAEYFARRLGWPLAAAERLRAESCWRYGSCTHGVLRRFLSADPSVAALHARGDECALVDDSPRNLGPARVLGMRTVLLARAHGPCPPRVDARVRRLAELPRALEGGHASQRAH